ncbi:Integrin beta-like protein 1 [Chelonia mydas]|uniref:Integrin beta-like protein 1 n=1 Tax=Chelonia mydas TaxID=8469 RepID=M7BNK6_CHEMY|nr:Integrin beta-like protein 1 [Chelonia mydas]
MAQLDYHTHWNCECGQCTCFPPGDNRVHGKTCECDDRQCEDMDGNVCGGHGLCSCGRCVCEDGWFGQLCQHPRKCNMTEDESKSFCESANGILCSGKGNGVCSCGNCECWEGWNGNACEIWLGTEYP